MPAARAALGRRNRAEFPWPGIRGCSREFRDERWRRSYSSAIRRFKLPCRARAAHALLTPPPSMTLDDARALCALTRVAQTSAQQVKKKFALLIELGLLMLISFQMFTLSR